MINVACEGLFGHKDHLKRCGILLGEMNGVNGYILVYGSWISMYVNLFFNVMWFKDAY